MKRKIRVLVVDDSAFMRKSIAIMLEDDEEIEVIGSARNGKEGYESVKRLRPDIITLDIEMPIMDGLEALKLIMRDCPTPVMMVSSLTTEGADATLKAMELGALDFIPKELSYININIIKIKQELIRKVKELVRHNLVKNRLRRIQSQSSLRSAPSAPVPERKALPRIGYRAVALGVSTGGPLSLQKVIPKLKNINVPMFIVQHMPPKFTKSLAERLNSLSNLTVKEAEDGEEVKNNMVYIAPGGYHMIVQAVNGHSKIVVSDKPSDTLHRPSVDVLFNSLPLVYGSKILGIIMTGMGKDGTEGLKKIKQAGGYCLAQDEESCIVYGMPRAAVEAGLADTISTLENIPEIINGAL